MKLALRVFVCFFVLLDVAHAGPRAENAAKNALKKAEDEVLAMTYDKALRRLQIAERGCGENGCAAETRAALVRDIGTMMFRLGQRDAAITNFKRAKKLDPKIALNPSYDAKDVREVWEAATATVAPQPAGGDFIHTPPRAGAALFPLALYFEPKPGGEELARVVVRYKSSSTETFRHAPLQRIGDGWGGTIPCADVVPGTISYYVQGFAKDGDIVASLGDARNTFSVRIEESLDGDPPALPGRPPPKHCGEEDLESLDLREGMRCQEDRQCRSGTCAEGRCAAPSATAEETEDVPREWAHVWIGVAGSIDFTAIPATSEVCAPGGSIFCTTTKGADYTRQDQLVGGRAGSIANQVTPGEAHITATVDWAPTPNLLLGLRVGYVANAYPGDAAVNAGKTIKLPIHVEVRATWVFGDEPLTKPGLAPYAFLAGGVARWDASSGLDVGEKGVAGDRTLDGWRVAGPAFAALGGGARYQFSPRIAVATGIDLTAALFPGSFALFAAPEMQVHYGF